MKLNQEQSKILHEAFHGQLEKADDPFTVLADYFGRGVFNAMPSFESAVSSHHVLPREVPGASTSSSGPWGLQNAGPGSEARLRKAEGKTIQGTSGSVLLCFNLRIVLVTFPCH